MRISRRPMCARAMMHVVHTGVQKSSLIRLGKKPTDKKNVALTHRGYQSETFLKFRGWIIRPIDPLFVKCN